MEGMTAAQKKPTPAKKLTLEQAQELATKTRQAAKAAALDLARLKHLQAKAQQEAERAADTRRKILLGAYVIAQAQAQGWAIPSLDLGAGSLSGYLNRDEDRALFGLPSLTPPPPTPGQGDALPAPSPA